MTEHHREEHHAPAVRQTIQTAPAHHGGGGGMNVQDFISLMQFARDFQQVATHEGEHHRADVMPVDPQCYGCMENRRAGSLISNPHRTTADLLWVAFIVFMIMCLFYGIGSHS